MKRLSVVITSFRRPDFLRDLLSDLVAQTDHGLELEVVVIDDDPAGSAGEVVERFGSLLGPFVYVVLGARNISLSRNESLDAATGDHLLLLDDDQSVAPGFLAELRDAWDRLQPAADGAILPREARFESASVSPFAPLFFQWPKYPAGTPVSRFHGRTGGLILRRDTILRLATRFDPAFGISGGGDAAFLASMQASGASIVWLSSPMVTERIPAERSSARGAFVSSFDAGRRWRSVRTRGSGSAGRLGHGIWALACLTVALLYVPVGALVGPRSCRKALLLVARQVGKVVGPPATGGFYDANSLGGLR